MQYFKIKNSLSKKEIGQFPQSIDSLWNGNRFDKNSFSFQGKLKNIIGKPAIPSPILQKKSKLTDLLSTTSLDYSKYIILSNHFFLFINKIINKPFQNWQIKVHNNEMKFYINKMEYLIKNKEKHITYNYQILHISYPQENFIDYSKSIFSIIKQNEKFKKNIFEDNISVKDKKEYNLLIEKYNKINLGNSSIKKTTISQVKPKRLTINKYFIKDNIFRVFEIGINDLNGYYVSEKLKNEIEKQGFTGIEFIPLNKITTAFDIEIINKNS